MILLFVTAAWILMLSLVAGLCVAARAGDLTQLEIPVATGTFTKSSRGEVRTVRPYNGQHRERHGRGFGPATGVADAPNEGSHPVNRIDRKLTAPRRRRSRALR